MPAMNVVNSSKRIRVKNAVAAGTSEQTTTAVDMTGFDSVVWVASFGTLTASQVTYIKAQGGQASDGSDAVDLAGTKVGPLADGDSNKLLVLEVNRVPLYRYLRLVIERGTANAVIDGVVATLSNTRKMPTVEDASVSARKTVVSPAAGTP